MNVPQLLADHGFTEEARGLLCRAVLSAISESTAAPAYLTLQRQPFDALSPVENI